MKKIGMILLLFLPMLAYSDIPRVDDLEVEYKGKAYYMFAITSHLDFKFGCVFNSSTKEYLCEEEDYLFNYFGNHGVRLYEDIFKISYSKLYGEVEDYQVEDFYRDKNVLARLGEKIIIEKSEIKEIKILGRIVGETAGRCIPQNITKSDEIWINDYPLEKIGVINGEWICSYEIYAIKGNVSREESEYITRKLKNCYRDDYGATLLDNKEIKLFLNELLQRNILVLEFCSC